MKMDQSSNERERDMAEMIAIRSEIFDADAIGHARAGGDELEMEAAIDLQTEVATFILAEADHLTKLRQI